MLKGRRTTTESESNFKKSIFCHLTGAYQIRNVFLKRFNCVKYIRENKAFCLLASILTNNPRFKSLGVFFETTESEVSIITSACITRVRGEEGGGSL